MRKASLIAFVAVMVIVGGIAVLSWIGNDGSFKDSGIVACEKMADRAANPKKSTGAKKDMTSEEHAELRRPFENSDKADIRVAGTNLVDTMYTLTSSEIDKQDLGGSMVTITTLHSQWNALRTACGNHGVNLPPLTPRKT